MASKTLRLLVLLAAGFALSLSLAACGKKGGLEPPAQSDDEKKKKKASG